MEDLLPTLLHEGWHLKKPAIETLKGTGKKWNRGEVIAKALNFDIYEIGEKYIQETIASCNEGVLKGPCVLQVSKIRNVSAPKDSEYSSVAPRMLKISLTDGTNTVAAIEYEQLSDISLKTPPGTKVKLLGNMVLSQGSILLTKSSLKVLGGRVEKLYTKWKIAQDMNAISRMDVQSDSGPPSFVAFGRRNPSQNRYNKSTKSLQDSEKDKESENIEFSEQRKAAIAEAKNLSDDKKESLGDARANFGKRPVNESKANYPRPDFNRRRNQHQLESKTSADSQKSVGMYRELSTDGGQAVHQKTVEEFVSMGFKRQDVVLCLRKTNNDFDETMDLLTQSSETRHTDDHHLRSRSNRGRHNTSRGRRGNARIESSIEEQSASQATLMDFIDNRMSNMLTPNKPEREAYSEATKGYQHTNDQSHTGSGKYGYRDTGPKRGGYQRRGYGRGRGREENWHQRNNQFRNQNSGSQDNPRHSQDKFRYQDHAENRQGNKYQQTNPSQNFDILHSKQNRSKTQDVRDGKTRNDSRYPYHNQNEATSARQQKEYPTQSHKHDEREMFNNVPLNPPPQRGPTTFGGAKSNTSKAAKPSPSIQESQIPPRFQQNEMPQRLRVTIPQWQVGSHCLAKYWEDAHYYHAVISDLHPKAPTAVVQFVDFGNYEEVQMFDLKPLPNPMNNHPIQGMANQYGQYQASEHQQRRQAKPSMAFYVSPKHRVNQ